ncbi:PEP-CTERM sorting domain-containing protein [Pelomonas sp. KK5]|uniref:PEP-CTERM sorting domain-containing protein n=1 Tax=Pelomonas sp. KK5 TaxID=1855730 RepID=UPI00097C841E|nr:PEP-CTERM sorting domain-containing protein [Pelomonas sp. KK5]
MKLKNVTVFAALALSAAAALADPVLSFNFSDTADGSGAYSEQFHFTLAQGANFFGQVDASSSVAGNFTIGSLLLSNGSTEILFDASASGDDGFDRITDSSSSITVKGRTSYTYTRSYAWDSIFLGAGDWTVTVTGFDQDDKLGGALNLSLIDPPANVPEPQTLALSAVALAALGWAGRRRRSVR